MNIKAMKTIFIGCLCFLFMLVLAQSEASISLANSATSSSDVTLSSPSFVIFPAWEWFDGLDWPDGTVDISVAGKPECTTSKESTGGFFNGAFPDGCDVDSGDVVTFDDGTTSRTLTVQYLTILDANAAGDFVEGMANEGSTVYVWPHATGQQVLATADSAGIWHASFEGIYDLNPDDCGRAQIYGEDGNATAIDWCVPRPSWVAFPDGDFVELHRWRTGVPVTASIPAKETCIVTDVPTNPDWEPGFLNPIRMYFPEGCDVSAGDNLVVTNELTTLEATVQYLDVTAIDGISDKVFGKADTGAPVHVWLHSGDGYNLWPVVDANGDWTADFGSAGIDLQENMYGRAQIDVGDTATAVDWYVPSPHIVASTAGDWFWTYGYNHGMLDISIYESASEGAALLWSGQKEADESGFMSIGWDTHGVDLKPGHYLVISDGIYTKTLVLELITMEVFDTEHEIMAGTAPLGRDVSAAAGPLEWQERITVQADPVKGTWKADFTSIGFDITDDMRGGSFAQIFDEDGDANEASVPQMLPSTFFDDFSAEMLTPGWYWENGDTGQWSLGNYGDNPGFLQLTALNAPTPAGNLLLRQIQQGDFSLETKFYFEPGTNFQFAGLVIYQDAENFLQFGRAFCDLEGSCVGNGLYFDMIAGGGLNGSNFATVIGDPSETVLRLERRGDMVKAFFSSDGGMTWYEAGTHWVSADFQVNGVGLVASQDNNTPDSDVVAYFDYFELNEGWNFLPEGFHDSPGGDVPSGECNGYGWAADPDDRAARLNIEIVVDDLSTVSLVAEDFRQDLLDAGVCEGGNCSFSTSLWGVISSYEPHRVDIWAQDSQTGDWALLSNSAKTLTCRTYDIYSFDPLSGTTQQITNLRDTDEYNPSWSPNGKKVVHDVLFGDGSQAIYITDLKTGISVPLAGAESGNDAVWSPNGKWIAYDDFSNVYLVPPTGGTATLIRSDAVSVDWAPSGKRIVFQQPSDGSIRTMAVVGGTGLETQVAASGANPAWSPDGNWIAYELDGDIWKVPVNIQGKAVGEPIQVTSGAFLDGQPTWSPDSQTIIYHSGFTAPEWDLWSVPASGGMGTWLTGGVVFADVDPSYARNQDVVGYASFTPDGQAARDWAAAYSYDLPQGTWSPPGDYTFQFLWEDALAGQNGADPERTLSVVDGAPLYDGYALIRPWATWVMDGEECRTIDAINPGQPTRFHVGYIFQGNTYLDAVDHYNNFNVRATWTGPSNGETTYFTRYEIIPYTNIDWLAYFCTFTR